MDPYGLYRQWFEGLDGAWKQMTGSAGSSSFAAMMNNPFMAALNPATAREGSATSQNTPGGPVEAQRTAATMGAAEAQNLWKQWFEAVNDAWREASNLGTVAVELSPRYMEMLEQMRHNFLSAEGYPADPLQLATRWYNATNGPLSEFIGDLLEREEFLEPSSQFLKSYASFYSVFKRNSEEYLKALQIPVRSDIARIAGLVLAVEDKVDRIEDAFEDFEYGYAAPAKEESLQSVEERLERLEQSIGRIEGNGSEDAATAESINGLDNRLDGVEAKIDQLPESLQAVEGRIERLQQSLQRVEEGGAGETSTDSINGLEERIDNVEIKLDRILTAIENSVAQTETSSQEESSSQEGGAQEAAAPEERASQTDGDIQATAAARRKAQELGVELSEVEGTGTNGQITVDDVRREGRS
jgi:prefoldin subunit 5